MCGTHRSIQWWQHSHRGGGEYLLIGWRSSLRATDVQRCFHLWAQLLLNLAPCCVFASPLLISQEYRMSLSSSALLLHRPTSAVQYLTVWRDRMWSCMSAADSTSVWACMTPMGVWVFACLTQQCGPLLRSRNFFPRQPHLTINAAWVRLWNGSSDHSVMNQQSASRQKRLSE